MSEQPCTACGQEWGQVDATLPTGEIVTLCITCATMEQ